jgi:YidC/Oxa1 family membrane protein insertase
MAYSWTIFSRRLGPTVVFHTFPAIWKSNRVRTYSWSPLSVLSSNRSLHGSWMISSTGFERGTYGTPFMPIHKRFSSTLEKTESIQEAINSMVETTTNTMAMTNSIPVDSLGKATDLVSVGLGSWYTPVGWLQNSMEFVHVSLGLPWWASIATIAMMIRACLFPLVLKTMINNSKLLLIQPSMTEIMSRVNQSKSRGDMVTAQQEMHKLAELFKQHQCNPLMGLVMPIVQIPVFICFFTAIRQMASAPLEGLKTGGLFWFSDLTVADPLYILPTISAICFLVTVELGADGISNQHQKKIYKNVFRVLAALSIPFTAGLPQGVFMYWLTSSFFSFIQLAFLKIPGMKARMGIIDVPQKTLDKVREINENAPGLWERLKQQWEEARKQNLEIAAKRAQEKALKKAIVAGPPVTFANRPSRAERMVMATKPPPK